MHTPFIPLALDDLDAVTGGGDTHPPTPRPLDPVLPPAPSPTLPGGHYIGNTAI